jgi:hypothetical protein
MERPKRGRRASDLGRKTARAGTSGQRQAARQAEDGDADRKARK